MPWRETVFLSAERADDAALRNGFSPPKTKTEPTPRSMPEEEEEALMAEAEEEAEDEEEAEAVVAEEHG